ncbi:MAG: hypothetical protein KJO79_09845, partial [Verrucomicrobiae bacterium]|nr:hypothetical protein [Verrucomicrobiae bacterium]NNJ87472.1 hypothetical protein [Akkermansiaceae bacterium]
IDLENAQAEIATRLNPTQPDIFLLADQAQIFILTGNQPAAKNVLIDLKKHRAPEWLTSRLENAITRK